MTGAQFPWDARCTCGWKGSEQDTISYYSKAEGQVTTCPRCRERRVILTPRCFICGWLMDNGQAPRNHEYVPRAEVICSACRRGRDTEDQAAHTGIDLDYYYETPLGITLDDNPVEGIDY